MCSYDSESDSTMNREGKKKPIWIRSHTLSHLILTIDWQMEVRNLISEDEEIEVQRGEVS